MKKSVFVVLVASGLISTAASAAPRAHLPAAAGVGTANVSAFRSMPTLPSARMPALATLPMEEGSSQKLYPTAFVMSELGYAKFIVAREATTIPPFMAATRILVGSAVMLPVPPTLPSLVSYLPSVLTAGETVIVGAVKIIGPPQPPKDILKGLVGAPLNVLFNGAPAT